MASCQLPVQPLLRQAQGGLWAVFSRGFAAALNSQNTAGPAKAAGCAAGAWES